MCSTVDSINLLFLSSIFSFFICRVLFEQVYDVTKFLEDHPGGDDVLLSATGKYS